MPAMERLLNRVYKKLEPKNIRYLPNVLSACEPDTIYSKNLCLRIQAVWPYEEKRFAGNALFTYGHYTHMYGPQTAVFKARRMFEGKWYDMATIETSGSFLDGPGSSYFPDSP